MYAESTMAAFVIWFELAMIGFFWFYFKVVIPKESLLRHAALPMAVFPGLYAGYGLAVLVKLPESFFDTSLLTGMSFVSSVMLICTRVMVGVTLVVLIDLLAHAVRYVRSRRK